jgi:hypothetical protein
MNKRHNRDQRADLRKFQPIHAHENRNSGHIPMTMAIGLAPPLKIDMLRSIPLFAHLHDRTTRDGNRSR